MSDLLKVVPRTREEFYDKMLELYKSRNHVKAIHVDEVTSSIRVDLDGTAHTFGHADMSIPLKKRSIVEAQSLVNHLNNDVLQKIEPSRTESDALFALLDLGQ